MQQPSAILDLHFRATRDRQDEFAVASSTATLSILKLSPANADAPLVETVRDIRIAGIGEDILFLSCSWHPTVADIIAVTTSAGEVLLVNTQNGTAESVISHSLEAWTVAFSPLVSSPTEQHPSAEEAASCRHLTLYSGGDDSSLKYLLGTLDGVSAGGSLSFRAAFPTASVGGHRAGVTAILPLGLAVPGAGRLVLTGSYDDCIRMYAIQPLDEAGGARRARLLAEENLGGGVWRLRLVDAEVRESPGYWAFTILASCMHVGARVVEARGCGATECQIRVLARFEEHKSMNYACDYQPSRDRRALRCVSTSFYDKLLCLWTWEREGQDNGGTPSQNHADRL